jgi:hypothetical protein
MKGRMLVTDHGTRMPYIRIMNQISIPEPVWHYWLVCKGDHKGSPLRIREKFIRSKSYNRQILRITIQTKNRCNHSLIGEIPKKINPKSKIRHPKS